MRRGIAALLALAACGSSAHVRERSAAELLAKIAGTSVFGPSTEYVPSELAEIGGTGMFATRPPEQCEVAVLPGGEDSFAARMAMLGRARHTIRIEALIFTADEAGLRIAEVLKQRKAAGVDVKVIVDGLNNPGLQTQWMYFDLKQHGIEVEGYEALGLQLANEIPIPLLTPFFTPTLANHRYHEKLWIVDAGRPGAEAVMGGLNIANEYFRVDPGNVARYWRDQDVAVRGAVLADLTATFDRNYEHFKDLKRRRGALTDKAWEATRAIMAKTGTPAISFDRTEALVARVAALEARSVELAYRPSRCRFLQSRPRLQESYIQQAYYKLLGAAQREVLIANAYLVATKATRMAIERAARRCVKITLLTNGAETSDTPGMSLLGRGHYAELLAINATVKPTCPEGGVEIYEWLGRSPGEARQTQGLLHAKFAVADRETALVGSFNLDPRSERLNSESALVFEHPELAGQLAKTYLERDLVNARRIDEREAATFAKPAAVFQRFKKELAGLVEDQL